MNVGPYDHLRPAAGNDAGDGDGGELPNVDLPDGVYRVVGVGDDGATLLRVGDGDGRRVADGHLAQVSADHLADFERATNPDTSPSVGRRLAGMATGLVWSVKQLLPQSLR